MVANSLAEEIVVVVVVVVATAIAAAVAVAVAVVIAVAIETGRTGSVSGRWTLKQESVCCRYLPPERLLLHW